MAARENHTPNALIASSILLQQLASVLPKDINFNIYHLSTPPTKASALYSAPPGARQDRTYCESHFLSASIRASAHDGFAEKTDVLVFAIEVLIYSTAYDTTFFVSKADSTGYLHLLKLPKGTPSPLREISATFLRHLLEQRQRPNIRSVLSLFARAQDQYLFPGSIEYSGKHVLDDRGLVRWWCRVLNPLVESAPSDSHWDAVNGYLIVPGVDTHETRSYLPRGTKAQWTIGHPLQKISRYSGDIPPRCLVPHFPDDPKSRYLDELDEEISKGQNSDSGQWKSVKSIDQFWDMMAFRQECSAGRLVGFIWIVFTPSPRLQPTESVAGDSQTTIMTLDSQILDAKSSCSASPVFTPATSFYTSSQGQPLSLPINEHERDVPIISEQSLPSSSPHTAKRKKLSGPIVARQPRIKTENKNYLLDKPESTAYYSWKSGGRGQVIVEETDYKRITELLLRLDFANLELATSSSSRWINEVRYGAWGPMKEFWGQTITGTKVTEAQNVVGAAGVNTLNIGLVRKKRKGGIEEPKEQLTPSTNGGTPEVNVLSAGMLRKKAKV
ncbi:Histone acetyltransferase [Hyphodiscus hymeniophilus]|uniref:histone acetyltransferase n=1 Tax=Hyphodiscus hymeniophilus TaxID=353542 RepID=A0A9P6VEV6_9HELO|nr:Histone acetyltransferase [Hyphodiscus hymeniophilus]